MTISPKISDSQLLLRLDSATRAARAGDKEGAITELKQLLDADPRHELANGMLASIYAELGLTDQATHYFRELLNHHPTNVLARFQLGILQLTAGKPQEAIETLQPMLSMEDDFLAHFHSGLAFDALHQPARAHVLFQQAATRMPSNHPLHDKLQALLQATE